MVRTITLALLGLLAFGRAQAQAGSCPVPDAFIVEDGGLPATKAAVEKRTLEILAFGGAATSGHPAHGAAFTYPARLEARLAEALPEVTTKVTVRAAARQSDAELLAALTTALSEVKPTLVIWGPGASAAARGDDLDSFSGTVNDAIGRIRAAGADLILMTLQYAPSVSRVVNLSPYRVAVLRGGEEAGVPVFDRYELMRFWSDSGFLDLDARTPDDRLSVSRTIYDCMAENLAVAIVNATK